MPTRERVAATVLPDRADEDEQTTGGMIMAGGTVGSVANDSDSEGSEFQDAQVWDEAVDPCAHFTVSLAVHGWFTHCC